MRLLPTGRRQGTRGSALVEFALVALQLMILIFAGFEFCRLVVVYTNVANAARIGCRYAITHGSNNTGSGYSGPQGPGNTGDIENIIRDYAKSGLLDPKRLVIQVTYPDSGMNGAGSRVRVRVTYSYDPFTGVLPQGYTNLGAVSEGIITF